MEVFRLISQIACFIGIVVAIMDSLYPSEKFQKQIKLIFSAVFILSVTSPLLKQDFSFMESVKQVSISENELYQASEDAYSYYIRSIENNISTRLCTELKQNKINCTNIQTSINISDNSSISINEVNITLENSEQIEDAKYIIRQELGDENVIVNYS